MNLTAELCAFPTNVCDDSFAKRLERYKKSFAGKGDYFEGKQNNFLLSSCVICSYRSNLETSLSDLVRFMLIMVACVVKRENFKAPCCIILWIFQLHPLQIYSSVSCFLISTVFVLPIILVDDSCIFEEIPVANVDVKDSDCMVRRISLISF